MRFQLFNSVASDKLPEYISKLESRYKVEKVHYNDIDHYVLTINNIVSLVNLFNILGYAIIIEEAFVPGCDYALEIYDGYRE